MLKEFLNFSIVLREKHQWPHLLGQLAAGGLLVLAVDQCDELVDATMGGGGKGREGRGMEGITVRRQMMGHECFYSTLQKLHVTNRQVRNASNKQ